MKIDKAIELLQAFVQPGPTALDPNDQAAINLGTEALLAWRQHRRKRAPANLYLLPGETPPKPLHALGFNTGDDESP